MSKKGDEGLSKQGDEGLSKQGDEGLSKQGDEGLSKQGDEGLSKHAIIPFPIGHVLDSDGLVWVTLPPGTTIADARIFGTCSCDPIDLHLGQVTLERGPAPRESHVDLLPTAQVAPFPLDRGYVIKVPNSTFARSTDAASIRIVVLVRRDRGIVRNDRGRIVRWPDPAIFRLVLITDGEEPS